MSFPKPGQPVSGALVAPLVTDPPQWQHLTWRHRGDPTRPPVSIRTGDEQFPISGTVVVRSYRDVYTDYREQPESKAATSTGDPVLPGTRGLLGPATITATGVDRIGKEANRLTEDDLVDGDDTNRCSLRCEPAADAPPPLLANASGAQTHAANEPVDAPGSNHQLHQTGAR